MARLSVLQGEEYLTNAMPRAWNELFARGIVELTVPPKLAAWSEISSTLDKGLTAFPNGQETAAAATARIAPQIHSLLQQAATG